METTTPQAIHEHFVQVIQAITPTYAYESDNPWSYVTSLPGEVSGMEIRRFTMDWGIAEPEPEGLYSLGEEYTMILEINVGYAGLDKETPSWLIQQDGVDLRTVLLAQLSPTCPGLLSVRRIDFSVDSDEEGHWYGSHVFRVNYMHDTGVSLPPIV